MNSKNKIFFVNSIEIFLPFSNIFIRNFKIKENLKKKSPPLSRYSIDVEKTSSKRQFLEKSNILNLLI